MVLIRAAFFGLQLLLGLFLLSGGHLGVHLLPLDLLHPFSSQFCKLIISHFLPR